MEAEADIVSIVTAESFEVPPSAKEARPFLEQTIAEFRAAMEVDSVPEAQENKGFREEVFDGVVKLLDQGFWYSEESWESYARMINVLRAGVSNGSIMFSDYRDCLNVYCALNDVPRELREVISHYVSTGEAMDMLGAIDFENETDNYKYDKVATKILTLYSFDMLNDVDDMPLEVRLNFSGFYDTEDKPEEQLNSESDVVQRLNYLKERVRLRTESAETITRGRR